jgi:hypothetical protein
MVARLIVGGALSVLAVLAVVLGLAAILLR